MAEDIETGLGERSSPHQPSTEVRLGLARIKLGELIKALSEAHTDSEEGALKRGIARRLVELDAVWQSMGAMIGAVDRRTNAAIPD